MVKRSVNEMSNIVSIFDKNNNRKKEKMTKRSGGGRREGEVGEEDEDI